MSPRNFIVKFDRPNATYNPGENITGCVTIVLDERKSVRDLKIYFKGESRVNWTTKRRKRRANRKSVSSTVHHTATEQYFSIEQSLLRKSAEEDKVELPEGESVYYFSFQLPTNIPCSFEHKVGYIRYTAKAIVDIPWKFDWSTKSAFTVITPYDLNNFSGQCVRIDDETSKDFYCLCFNRGSLRVQIRVPSSGYVPGQYIMTEVFSNMKSEKVHVTKISAKLEEELIFRAHGSTKRDLIMIQKDQDAGPIKAIHQSNLKLYVPSLPPSNLEYCGIIELKYQLRVNVHVSGMHKKVKRKYPILIGTVPLFSSPWASTNNTYPTAPLIDQEPSVFTPIKPVPMPVLGPEITLPSVPQPNFNEPRLPNPSIGWNIPPPSYEECMQKADNIEDEDDSNSVHGADQPFAPRYPVFNFIASDLSK
ncbi:arrestin domain-containing protein 17-like isoform X2 [Polistes fuscatus]|uniref:arrestin domain-containing protein 17-like isoform X2 n=1 Tax=Polistes fuscatus TaxID=30207 RepID=UPI001CA84923|nr:arrestin domain-containing protein 17-like isoform X2 [Polistes fuscatus]XP_043491583.1 arrestin domain-containing protein 17-like isoform X2 [Polistes fuscatus]